MAALSPTPVVAVAALLAGVAALVAGRSRWTVPVTGPWAVAVGAPAVGPGSGTYSTRLNRLLPHSQIGFPIVRMSPSGWTSTGCIAPQSSQTAMPWFPSSVLDMGTASSPTGKGVSATTRLEVD